MAAISQLVSGFFVRPLRIGQSGSSPSKWPFTHSLHGAYTLRCDENTNETSTANNDPSGCWTKNRGKNPKWMVKIMENTFFKWMIWGENSPIFGNIHFLPPGIHHLQLFDPSAHIRCLIVGGGVLTGVIRWHQPKQCTIVGGGNPANHTPHVWNPDIFTTYSTGDRRISEPSTVLL